MPFSDAGNLRSVRNVIQQVFEIRESLTQVAISQRTRRYPLSLLAGEQCQNRQTQEEAK